MGFEKLSEHLQELAMLIRALSLVCNLHDQLPNFYDSIIGNEKSVVSSLHIPQRPWGPTSIISNWCRPIFLSG